jgi:uncharacterized membrane protein
MANKKISDEEIEWLSKHKQSIERRDKILKGLGGFLLLLGVSVGNYFLLSAANITTFLQGIIAIGFEFMLAFLLMLALFKPANKKMESLSIVFLAFAVSLLAIIFLAFAVSLLAIIFSIATTLAPILATVVAPAPAAPSFAIFFTVLLAPTVFFAFTA